MQDFAFTVRYTSAKVVDISPLKPSKGSVFAYSIESLGLGLCHSASFHKISLSNFLIVCIILPVWQHMRTVRVMNIWIAPSGGGWTEAMGYLKTIDDYFFQFAYANVCISLFVRLFAFYGSVCTSIFLDFLPFLFRYIHSNIQAFL